MSTPNLYYRDNSGKEIGPFDLDTLAKLRATGVLNENILVRSGNFGEWKPLRELLPPSVVVPQASEKSSGKSTVATWGGLFIAIVIILVASHYNNSSKEPKAESGTISSGENSHQAGTFIQKMEQTISTADNDENTRIACVNNLKQIGLAMRIWEGDNGDKYPFNVGTPRGGTMEFCDRGSDGFDKNAYLHFQIMSNELTTPKILVCPSDSKQPANDFAHLRPINISYQLRSGPEVTDLNPREILVVCPIHNNVLFADGSVVQLSPQQTSAMQADLRAAEAISQVNSCINNLRQIDGAVNEWALEQGKMNGSLPTWDDIKPYIKLGSNGKIPSCPAGGRYTLHPVGSNPQVTCSIPAHVLP